jgi:hypothetical protein
MVYTAPIERLNELVPLYGELLGLLADAGAGWVQLDEPILVTGQVENAAELARRSTQHWPALHVDPRFLSRTISVRSTVALS